MLYYRITGHTFVIHTPDDMATEGLMDDFKAFRVHIHPPDDEILFHFSGNTSVVVPLRPPDNDFNRNGVNYKVYAKKVGWVIIMKAKDKEHMLFATPDWKHVHTDLTLTNEDETLFLNNFLAFAFDMASSPCRSLSIQDYEKVDDRM